MCSSLARRHFIDCRTAEKKILRTKIMDRKAVNKSTPPKKYGVACSKKLGRYIVAAKDLSPGEVILREDALAVGPGIFETNIFCFACMRPLSGYHANKLRYTCTKCNVAPLCSRLCEDSVGLHSTRECNVFREKKDLFLENIEELVRILLHLRLWLLKDDNEKAWDRVESMEAHLNERKNTPVWHKREKEIVDVFRKFGLSTESDDSLQRLCGVVDVNTFELRSPGGPCLVARAPLLRGLFPDASLMAHACRATGHVSVDEGFRMTVYAALPISAGEPVYFNYTSALLGTVERQEHLQEEKYFRCECSTCKDPLENGSYLSCILCPRCRKDYVAIQSPNSKDPYGRKTKWQCQKCKRILRGCLMKSTIEISKNLISQVDEENLKAMENLLEKLSRTFHKNHFLMISLKQKILDVYRKEITTINPQRKTMQKMLDMCKELLDVLEIVEPGVSRLKGILLYELHLPIVVLANRAYAAREIDAGELHARLVESCSHLKRALTMLLLEPPATPEAALARRALQEMKMLAQNVADAKALMDAAASQEAQKTRSQKRGKNRCG